MSTLLLRLAAPMQSWGTDSKFDTRDTGREPTKSGVLGLLAAACGIRRDDTTALRELSELKFGVRVEQEGELLYDFHMAHGIKKKNMSNKTYVELQCMYMNLNSAKEWYESYRTYRYYLCDAVFLCGLEVNDAKKLEYYADSIKHPAFPLFLGRRSCPPTLPLVLGIRDCDLETALREEPPLVDSDDSDDVVRIVLDVPMDDEASALANDVPVSFSPRRREFSYRKYREIILPKKSQSEHDPFAEVEAEYVSDTNGT